MNDLEQGLMAGRGKKESNQVRKRFEECELKVKTLRNKNNELQKQCDNELMEGDIKSAIRAQTGFIDNEITDLKKALEKLSKDFTDPASKNKIKEICAAAGREMERNKRIMQEFMNRASASSSVYKRDSTHPYNKSRSQMDKDFFVKKKEDNFSPVHESNSIIASQDMVNDLKAEQKMLAERNALLKELEEKNNKINAIMNEMGAMVGGEQKDMINAMQDNMIAVRQNMQDANQQMDDAIVYQKKSKKKYICIISVIVVVLLIAFGLLFFVIL